ncbi:MAG: PD-(D/E)XK nuclease family protein, partial [Gammaproteobacteria bacterium]|nr:PD-(D/E)XK nuclease family protein [Gammaproteobacteria bacterium]
PNISLYEQLLIPNVITQLSDEGQQRLQRILPILRQKMSDRYRYSKRLWIESTWLLLGGPACVSQSSDLEDATVFFNLLESMDQTGTPLDIDVLHNKVRQLYASADNHADNSLQLMTIHNAKGLEFDTVILPHLERRSPHDDKQLLLWMERPLQQNSALIIAPVQAVGHDADPIYDYIKRQHTIKTEYENGRLLYVAATRAKKRLHLLFSLEKNEKGDIVKPSASSLLGKLWYSISPTLPNTHSTLTNSISSAIEKNKYISRLSLSWKNPIVEPSEKISFHNETSGFCLRNNTPQLTGTFIHRLLQQISRDKTLWESLPISVKNQYIQKHLTQLGVISVNIAEATNKVLLAIENTLTDPRGQWIIKNHTEAKSEFPLTALIGKTIQSLIIDRTFIDENNIRWIIDYKTTTPSDSNIETFILAEKEKYNKQMLNYAEAILKIDTRPIKYGLYFPLLPVWHEWG